MPLDQINAEIAEIQALPMGKRTVNDTDRLRDLLDARRRITGSQGCGWARGPRRSNWCLIAGGLRSRVA